MRQIAAVFTGLVFLASAVVGIRMAARGVLRPLSSAKPPHTSVDPQPISSSLVFSTYIGGSEVDLIRDVETDAAGNIYITGGTASPNFPTTPGAYQNAPGGWMDVFVAKLDPNGRLLWSTRIGGPNYDRAYGLEVDDQGYVYVAGRAGPGFPTTSNAFQSTFQGTPPGPGYGAQNAFVCKLMPDGSDLVFCSYIGPWAFVRDVDIDDAGAIYVAGIHDASRQTSSTAPASWFVNAFQKTPSSTIDAFVVKIATDGSAVIWATYFGGTGDDDGAPTIRAKDDDGTVYVLSAGHSVDLPTTPTALQKVLHGSRDFYIARFTADGSGLIYSTYLGGAGEETTETHQLMVDAAGNAYVTGWTTSPDFPTTPGAVQTVLRGNYDIPVAKISGDGSDLLTSTYLGGSNNEGAEGIDIDDQGNVVIFGVTRSSDFPVTSDGLQSQFGGVADFFVARLAPGLDRVLYASFLGGGDEDSGRTGLVDRTGHVIIGGMTQSDDWPQLRPLQDTRGGLLDGALAKVALSPSVPTSTATSTPTRRLTSTATSTPTRRLTSTATSTPTRRLTSTATSTPTGRPTGTPTSTPNSAPTHRYLPLMRVESP
jgi:hypothetical protein